MSYIHASVVINCAHMFALHLTRKHVFFFPTAFVAPSPLCSACRQMCLRTSRIHDKVALFASLCVSERQRVSSKNIMTLYETL